MKNSKYDYPKATTQFIDGYPTVTRQFTHPYPNNVENYIKLMNDLQIAKASGVEREKATRLLHESLDTCSCPKKRTASGKILTNHDCF